MSRCEQPENLNRCLVQNISTISAGYGLLTLVNEVPYLVPVAIANTH